jgi:hypothetical protein
MEPLTIDALRTLAKAQGLDLSDDELRGVLPLVQAGRTMMDSVRDVPRDVEPASQYRIL